MRCVDLRKVGHRGDLEIGAVMTAAERADFCLSPKLSELVTPYCFGEMAEADREHFEQHLLDCDVCWREVRRLSQTIGVMRTNFDAHPLIRPQELVGLLG